MNTADIRNTEHNQAFFWAIAIPVTAGIVGFAVFIAYQGGVLYDTATKALHQFREESAKAKTTPSPGGQASLQTRLSERRRSLQKRIVNSRRREMADAQLPV
jgi:hypothetical protein